MDNVVWKEEFNPSEDLTKHSQYARAYSGTTMDKALQQTCNQELEKNGRLIAGIQSLTWDIFWFFLVKPYSQRAALKYLTDAIGYMIHDATYSAQLHSCLSHPLELQPMLAIY